MLAKKWEISQGSCVTKRVHLHYEGQKMSDIYDNNNKHD